MLIFPSALVISYVKLDWCIKSKELRTPAVREKRTNAMARAMNKTGRPMWLTFHCTYVTGSDEMGVEGEGVGVGPYQDWCAEDGNSWRIGPDQ
jgi:hypothetical protein